MKKDNEINGLKARIGVCKASLGPKFLSLLLVVIAMLLVVVGVQTVVVPTALAQALTVGQAKPIEEALERWDVAAAGKSLAELKGDARPYSDGGDSGAAEILKSRMLFLKGEYQAALESAELVRKRAQGKSLNVSDLDDWLSQLKATMKATQGYKKFLSPHGYFEVSLRPGKDELLLPIAFEVLERGYTLLTQRLGVSPKTPIRVEVYPTFDTLADVSSLTKEDIRNTGIIALCKFNRVMVTSPSAQPYGYSWADTLVHEFVHYLVHSRTSASVPIWLHEGTAKYLERIWRTKDPLSENGGMLPSSSDLLMRRMKAGTLIPFEAMHPSIAKLPTQDDASLAFAEVHSLVDFVVRSGTDGAAPLKTTFDQIDRGVDAQKALAMSVKMTPKQLQSAWKKDLNQRHFLPFPAKATYEDGLHAQSKTGTAPIDKIENPKANDYASLAMMLQARGLDDAALVEFRKSVQITGPIYPFVVTRMATVLNKRGTKEDAEEAIKNLESLLKIYPTFAPAYLQLGRAKRLMNDTNAALDALNEALYINPFDPGIYSELLEIYDKLGEKEKKLRVKNALKLLK